MGRNPSRVGYSSSTFTANSTAMNSRFFVTCPAALLFFGGAALSARAQEGSAAPPTTEGRPAGGEAEEKPRGAAPWIERRSPEQDFDRASAQLGEVRELIPRGQLEVARRRIGEVMRLLEAIRAAHPGWNPGPLQQRLEEARQVKMQLAPKGPGGSAGEGEKGGEGRRRVQVLEEALRLSRQREAALRAVIRDLIQQLDGRPGMPEEGSRDGSREGRREGAEPEAGRPGRPVGEPLPPVPLPPR